MTTLTRTPPLGADEFFEKYVRPCEPVVIEGLVKVSGAGAPWSVDYLRRRVGQRKIPVEVPRARNIFGDPAGKGVQHEWTSVEKFLDRVMTQPKGAQRYLAQLDLARTFPELLSDLPRPVCLDRVYCEKTALWIGPGDQVTPLHYDVYDNLVYMMEGRKTWTLVSPRDSVGVYPRSLSAYNYSQVDIEQPDLDRFPAFADVNPIVEELSRGDALFVPGGWWHHVRGHGLNIAVNTMWLPPVVPQ
ncbi:MAG: cupin-like domain-containing protein [Betaproteobacteria bacterium]